MRGSTSAGGSSAHPEAIQEAATAVDEAVERLYATVREARDAGQSWATIGGALGVTKQAAQERFGGRRRGPRAPKPRSMRG